MSRREHVATAARRLATEGLLVGTAGNVSVRDGDRSRSLPRAWSCATARRSRSASCRRTGEVVEGSLLPTSELDLHLNVYAATDAAAVVHTHAPFSTAVACVLDELPVIHYQHLLLGGTIRVAPYATFGTPELAANVRDALADRQAALMANHGSVAVGGSLEKAVDNALLLEWLATLHHRASALGTPKTLTDDEQADVITQALQRNYGTTASINQEKP